MSAISERDRDAARAALRAMFHPPAWVQGGISVEDAEFLMELVLDTAPGLVVELGVAAGTSSAALLFALDQLPPLPPNAHGVEGHRVLYSSDIRVTCYFDEHRLTGSAVDEMFPLGRARTGWALATNDDARRIARERTRARGQGSIPPPFDLAFIDADHRHPWALFDLLYLARELRGEAWVALHDIDLPRLYPQFPSHGPMWLFEAWPFETRRRSGSSNIGAVRLPADLGALVPMALALLKRPWEAHATGEGLATVFAPIEAAARRQARLAARPTGERR